MSWHFTHTTSSYKNKREQIEVLVWPPCKTVLQPLYWNLFASKNPQASEYLERSPKELVKSFVDITALVKTSLLANPVMSDKTP